jgi:GntR family transcriptional regulator
MADPMYRQIAEDLRSQIEEGSLAPGQQLRTELELREKYNASRNTVRDAIKWLITGGFVETRPGQGTFVTEKIDPFVTTLSSDLAIGFRLEGVAYGSEVRERSREPMTSDPRVEMQRATPKVAEALGVGVGSSVVSRHQQRYIDRIPWSLQTSFYPMRLVEREHGARRLLEAADIDEGAVKYLANALSIKLAGWRDRITVRAPDETEAAFFKLPGDGRVSVIETRRTGFDGAGVPFVLTISVYPADRNEFVINVGDVPAEAGAMQGTGQQETDGEQQATAGPATAEGG